MMCELVGVSRSGYYAWKNRKQSARAQEDKVLTEELIKIHKKSRETYGSRRVHHELNIDRGEGERINRKRVERLMRDNEIQGRERPKPKKTEEDDVLPPVENLIARNFSTDEPDRAWVSDITYIWTAEGWLYLAIIIDLFSRRVVGWSMASHMRKELTLDALKAALGHRKPSEKGLVFHSDQGSQYTSAAHRKALEDAGITPSMSRRGKCLDNAVAESFNSTLKNELVYRTVFLSRASAQSTIAEWIECFYNRQRRHSTLGYATPVEFEERFYQAEELLSA